jgi:integrase
MGSANVERMKGHKRWRSGAWRLAVFAGINPDSGKQRYIHETVHAPNNRAGAKVADARLAVLITAVESGRSPDPARKPKAKVLTVAALAGRWQAANQPRQNERTGDWIGWSPKTAKTHAFNFRRYILPTLGDRDATVVTGLDLDDLYRMLEAELSISPTAVLRCHSQIRAMYSWALRKKLVETNPALAADPPRTKPGKLQIPSMDDVRVVQAIALPAFAAYVQLAATVGARRGTLLALRWGDLDLEGGRATFTRAIAESEDGVVEKGTKADRPYVSSLGPSTVSALQAHRQRAIEQALRIGVPFGPESFVFSDDGGLTHWNLSWPSHAWKRYSAKAGVKPTRLHDLRHTAASQMLMAGVAISIVAERLGCTEANILRTYRHFIPGSDREAAVLMDRMLSGAN